MVPFERFDCDFESRGMAVQCLAADISGSTLTVEVECPKKGFTWWGFIVSYNNKVEEDRESYFVPAVHERKEAKTVQMTLLLDLDFFPLHYTHWSISCLYEADGKLFISRIRWKSTRSRNPLGFILRDDCYTTPGGDIAYLYRQEGRYLGIRYREKSPYDSRATRATEVAVRAYCRFSSKPPSSRKVWLIYEKRCQKAQDNGYYFFKYCMENGIEEKFDREIYYIIDKSVPDYAKLAPYDRNVVDFMSAKHMLCLMADAVLLSPDSQAHAYAWQVHHSLIASRIRKLPHVFLGHGVLALKRLNDSFTARSMKSVLCTVVSEDEKRIFTEELGFRKTSVAITGYARFDALHDTSAGRRDILVMPTHRSWLFGVEREVFVASDYYRRYMDLINSPQLNACLEEHDANLMFYLHPSIKEHADAFASPFPRVKVVLPGEDALDDLMMASKMLVTDYSSIAWDMLYMGKPVVFYQYDRQAHLDTWGSYIDLEKDSPGICVADHDELIAAIENCINGGFELSADLEEKRRSSFEYLNQGNSQRICDELKLRRL